MASDRRPATRHVIGSALREACPAFEGKPGQDISEWLAEFLRLASTHEIPSAFLSNELIIKLKGKAAKWFQTAFPGAADVSPPGTDLQSAVLSCTISPAVTPRPVHIATFTVPAASLAPQGRRPFNG